MYHPTTNSTLDHTDLQRDGAVRALSRQDYKTLALASLGGALEFYDFIIFVFLANTIGQLFFPSTISEFLRQLQTFGIFAAGYLIRPLSGVVFAHFGDLRGRKNMFALSILLMTASTIGIGLLPTFPSVGIVAPLALLLFRMMQGAAVGGEVAGAFVFVSEHVPNRRIGFACGTVTAGLTIGILLGSLIATILYTWFSQQQVLAWGWRIPFLLGGVFGVIAIFFRRWLNETPVFAEMQRVKALAVEVPVKAVLRDHRSAVVKSILLTWLLSSAIIVVVLMTPTLLQKLDGFSAKTALFANSIAIFCLIGGCLIAGLSVDRFGAKKTITVGCLLLAVNSCLFYIVIASIPALLFPLYAMLGLSVGVVGAIPSVLVSVFPPQLRFSGVSFAYNLSYAIFGGLTPVVITLMLKSHTSAPAIYVATVCMIGVATVLLMD